MGMSAALDQYLSTLELVRSQAEAAFLNAADGAALEQLRIDFVGAKSGKIKDLQKGLGQLDKTDKPLAGQKFNACKQALEEALAAAQQRLAAAASRQSTGPRFDPTPPGPRPRLGHLHPLTQTMEELKQIMGRLGFEVAEGPEIEDEWHNFDALNIPAAHPARDPLDNFYLAVAEAQHGPWLLRSQTSTVQIRVMEQRKPPVRIISMGRVYRPDSVDRTHSRMFHQIEGLLIDRGITMAHLKTTLRLFARSFLGQDVHIAFRPSFFPFTEPSVEVDMLWGKSRIEMGGAGMVDPHVLQAVGYDPEEVTGFAFGLGIERICMRRHQITDIHEFYKNDVRFLHQF